MKRLTLLLISVGVGFPIAAQSQTGNANVVTVELSNFKFSPQAMHLRAGVPVVLRLHNLARGGHNFRAPEFFSAAKMSPSTAKMVKDGTVEIPTHSTVDISLIPSPGSYQLKCSHTLHSAFGMKGVIRVD